MKKKCIVFDLDGTLLDTKLDLLYALNECFIKYNIPTIDEVTLIKHLGRGLQVLFNETAICNYGEDIKRQMFIDFKNNYNNHSTVFTSPYKGVYDTLIKLKEKGYKLAVVSNKADEYAKKIINYYFLNIFDYVSGSIDGVLKKPNPDLVYMAIEYLNVKKDECVYIGDSIYDLMTANNSGLDSIILSYGYGDMNQIKEMGARIIIDNFNEILDILGE